MIDELIAIRLEDLCRIYQQSRDWPAFRRAVIEAAAVRVEDGKGHPEPKPAEKYRDRLLSAAIRFRDRKRGGELDFLAVCDAIFAELDDAPKFPKPNGDGPTYA